MDADEIAHARSRFVVHGRGFLLACGGDTHRGGGTFGGGVSGVWWVWVGGGGDDGHSVVLF